MHKDKYGIIGQIQDNGSIEGGDSVNWMGHWIYVTDDKDKFPFVNTFEVDNGAYVRHPYAEQTNNGFGAYYKNPYDGVMSRDQMTGTILGLIAKQNWRAGLRMLKHHAMRGFLFAYNTRPNGEDPEKVKWQLPDITGPDILAMIIRAIPLLALVLYPLLIILDLHVLIAAIVHRYSKNDDDVISLVAKYMATVNHFKTPTGVLVEKVANTDKMMKELNYYWSGWRDTPEIVPFYRNKL